MRQARKSNLFLIELIIAILFFTLSSAVCVNLFSVSFINTKESEFRNAAILEAQSIAEIFRNDNGDMTTITELTSAVKIGDNQYVYYMTEKGDYAMNSPETGAFDVYEAYVVWLTVTEEDGIQRLDITITPPDEEEAMIELSTKIYIPIEVGGATDES